MLTTTIIVFPLRCQMWPPPKYNTYIIHNFLKVFPRFEEQLRKAGKCWGTHPNATTHSPAISQVHLSFSWVPRVFWALWPAYGISHVGQWVLLHGESGLIHSISPEHSAECRCSAKAGLSMKLKMSPPLKWRSGSTPGHGRLRRHWSLRGAELASGTLLEVTQATLAEPHADGGEQVKGTEWHLPVHTLFPSRKLIPIWGQQGSKGACQYSKSNAKSCSVKNWLFRKCSLLHSGQLLNLMHDTLWSSLHHLQSSLWN